MKQNRAILSSRVERLVGLSNQRPTINVLNLYSGIGGNRMKWENVQATAIENDPAIADVYLRKFPHDDVFVCDAHKYLEDHYSEFDFIWSSPPCPSHGQYRHNVGVLGKGFKPIMPDMKLYAEIVFLKTYFKGKWVVENVRPYYKPLIAPSFEMHRHFFWSNFEVEEMQFEPAKIRSKNKISDFEGHEIVSQSRIKNKRQVLRNMIDPNLGLHILEQAY